MIKNLKYAILLSFCLMGCEKSTTHYIDGGAIQDHNDGGTVQEDNDDTWMWTIILMGS